MLRESCRSASVLLLIAAALGACTEPTNSPANESLELRFAKAAASTGPTVTATLPSQSALDTTLDVQVSGSGFDSGSRADFLLNGIAIPGVRTNSTRFVSSTSLVANVTIAKDAVPDKYDVAVTTSSGKKGIGTELFTVLAMQQLAAPPGNSAANDVTASGVIVGWHSGGCDGYGVPVIWADGVNPTPLPMLSGLCRGTAIRINEAGLIVGKLWAPGSTTAVPVFWKWLNPGYSVQSMGTIPTGPWQDLTNLNEVGHAVYNAGHDKAFWWSETAGFVPLPSAAGSTGCGVQDINDNDEISGVCYVGDLPSAAFWASPSSTPILLPRLTGYNYAHNGNTLNNSGVVAGQAWNRLKSGRLVITGVRWIRTGTSWNIETLPDLGGGETDPRDINDAGWMTGSSRLSNGHGHAFLWARGQAMRDLGSLGPESWAGAITPSSAIQVLIVGQSNVGSFNRAVLWRP